MPHGMPTLYEAATYRITVPGYSGTHWAGWASDLIVVDLTSQGCPVTILTGRFDQAALIGLLRRLYAHGVPLISVVYVDGE